MTRVDGRELPEMSSPIWSPDMSGLGRSRGLAQHRDANNSANLVGFFGQHQQHLEPHQLGHNPMELLESQALDLSELAQRSTTATEAQGAATVYEDSPGGPRSASIGGDNSAQLSQGQKRKSFEVDDGGANSSKGTRAKRNRVSIFHIICTWKHSRLTTRAVHLHSLVSIKTFPVPAKGVTP